MSMPEYGRTMPFHLGLVAQSSFHGARGGEGVDEAVAVAVEVVVEEGSVREGGDGRWEEVGAQVLPRGRRPPAPHA